MEQWAARIQSLMSEAGKTQADVARACKIQQGSVSGWFGGGKATKMISGDNLVAVASLLGTSAEFIMTGRGAPKGARPVSQPLGLDTDKLTIVLGLVDGAIRDSRKQVPPRMKAAMIRRVYELEHAKTPDFEATVRADLASILEGL